MSRTRQLIRSSIWGYLSLLSSIVYGFGSIPLALHFLSLKEFGLWAVVQQVTNYLLLVDLGMSASLARILIDRKDDPNPTAYGSTILTAALVLAAQGIIVIGVGFLAALLLPTALGVPNELALTFGNLLFLQSAVVGVGFTAKIFSQLLYSNHRLDIQSAITILGFITQFLVLWLAFYFDSGVYSLVWGTAGAFIVGTIASISAVKFLSLLPKRGAWASPQFSLFREIFAYGTGLFLITVGNTLIFFSQTIIVTRFIGLAEAGIWTVCTRAFMLILTICWRPFESSYTLFCEMISKGEAERLYNRFRSISSFTLGCATFAAIAFAACNQPFVTFWTSGKVHWPAINNIYLALWMLLLTMVRCHTWLIQATKDLGFLRFIYFIEGLAFVLFASLAAKHWGFAGVILASVGCTFTFTLPYAIWRSHRYFNISTKEVLWGWSRGMRYIILLLSPAAIVLSLIPDTGNALINFSIHCGGVVLVSLPLMRFLFDSDMRRELLNRLPRQFQSFALYILGRSESL